MLRRVEYVLGKVCGDRLPVNLIPVAKFQRVLKIELLPMMVEGCTKPVRGGFEIFIQNDVSIPISVNSEDDVSSLKPRQRFTFAHEIIHTFFYDWDRDPPKQSKHSPKSDALEKLCNYGAGHLLLPTRLLKKRIEGKNPATHRFVLSLAKEFGLSTEVIIRQLNEIDFQGKTNRALLLLNFDDSFSGASITAYCFHPSLLPYLNKPQVSLNLKDWSPIFGEVEEFLTEPAWEHHLERGKCELLLKRNPHPTRPDMFFLEVELNPRTQVARARN